MKICLITPLYGASEGYISGVYTSVKLFASSLAKLGHDVDVYAFDGKKHSVEAVDGINIIRFKTPPIFPNFLFNINISTFLNLKKKIRKYDLVHVYNTWQIPAAVLLTKKAKIPVTATLNNYHLICPSDRLLYNGELCDGYSLKKCSFCFSSKYHSLHGRYTGSLLNVPYTVMYLLYMYGNHLFVLWGKRYLKKVNKFIAISDVVKDMYVENGVGADKIEVIPNILDNSYLNVSSHHDKKEYPDTLLYVGTISYHKGVDVLIDAFINIQGEYPNLKLWIIGHGHLENKLKADIKKLGLEHKVIFLDTLSYTALREKYQKADIFIHPGRWPEPFGRTILEAMASMTPIIVSDVGAPPQIVGRPDMIFKSGCSEELAQKIAHIINERDVRHEISNYVYNRVTLNYGMERVLPRIKAFYDKIHR